MNLGLDGKIAIVSGASRGIGRACAEELAREGADVVLVARDATALVEVRGAIEKLGRRAITVACDLREPTAAAKAVQAGVAAFGGIGILVHSAGATKRGDFFSLTDADFDDGFALKFMGAVRLAREAWPHLVKAQGTVVNIIGVGGRNAEPDFTIGGPVNAALMNFTKAMALRGVKEGVRVTGINPGLIDTDRLRRRLTVRMAADGGSEDEARRAILAEHGIANFGKPEDIGKLVCYLAGNAAGFMQGTLIDTDGGETHGV
jgi:NAD(P)-dependent dehydrogenase (short-subunit alcohol dehydrogenase family)